VNLPSLTLKILVMRSRGFSFEEVALLTACVQVFGPFVGRTEEERNGVLSAVQRPVGGRLG
jgi:hypothetical protein